MEREHGSPCFFIEIPAHERFTESAARLSADPAEVSCTERDRGSPCFFNEIPETPQRAPQGCLRTKVM